MEFLIVLAVLFAVVFVVTAPWRRSAVAQDAGTPDDDAAHDHLIDLEAAREAKYREIRDADLDHRTGKLSDADYEAVDAALRAEAISILHELDRARAAEGVDS